MHAPTTRLSLSLLSLLSPLAAAPQNPPPTIEWQRTLEDALAVQKATGLPLLIAVNMDGEVFNEQFANEVYKSPTFVETTRGYVCVVASPDRHTPADHDALGRRIECPRFPGCTCGEHIAIEPKLFERWFGGTRNAPRHLGVSPDGKVLFDRFLDASKQTAIDAIRKHRGAPKPEAVPPTTLEALFARRDAASRRALERRYRNGDATARKVLLAAAVNASNEPWDLLRMALRDPDDAVFARAALAVAKLAGSERRTIVENALARVEETAVQQVLVTALAEIGRDDPAAARLAAHHAPRRPVTLPAPWSGPWRAPAFDPRDRASVERELDRCEAALRSDPNDETTRLALATAQSAFADVLIEEGGRNIEFWFADSRTNAAQLRNTTLQNEAQALLAYAAYMTGDAEAAAGATRAAQAASANAREPDPWVAKRLLELELLSTVNTVYADADGAARRSLDGALDRATALLDLLAARGGGKEQPVLAGIGLLEFAGLRRDARLRLGRLAVAFPASTTVHERWRTRLFADVGPEAARREYAAFVDATTQPQRPTAEWFAGYCALLAAEQHMRDERTDVAHAAYDDAVTRFERCAAGAEEFADSAWHHEVLARAGRASLRFAAGDATGAVDDLVRAAELRADSLDTTDGLLRKPRAIAGRIARELEAQGKVELAAKLQPILP